MVGASPLAPEKSPENVEEHAIGTQEDTEFTAASPVEKTIEEDAIDLNATDIEIVELQPAVQEEVHPQRIENQIHLWEAKRGKNLNAILKEWSEIEQVTLIWDANESYKLNKDIFISGTLENALDILFTKGLRNAPKHELTFTPTYTLRIYN